jgi:hypothetical protein
MNKLRTTFAIAGLALGSSSFAHFAWLFFAQKPSQVTVQFGESPNKSVLANFVGKRKQLLTRFPINWREMEGNAYQVYEDTVTARLPYDVMNRGGTYFLYYHAKACRTLEAAAFRTDSLAELTLRDAGSQLEVQMFLRGKQVRDVEFQVYNEDNKSRRLKAGPDGVLTIPKSPERIALWGVTSESLNGNWNGKPYAQVRHYATLTVPAR